MKAIKNIYLIYLLLFSLLVSCKDSTENEVEEEETTNKISAVDISNYPEIELTNPVFYNEEGTEINFLSYLSDHGVNTVRLRLWVDPVSNHSTFDEVQRFSQELKGMGFKIWLTVHYSDTWADPGHQETPERWKNLSYEALKDSVYEYTSSIVNTMSPEYIQVGNEINTGILHPIGTLQNMEQFKGLLKSGIKAVRDQNTNTKIILHYAGIEGSDWFFNEMYGLDYDIIGLSYYPLWHGKSLSNLSSTLSSLASSYDKDVLVAETAYAFTLGWNDWTNNIIGSDDQLITPDYPSSAEGQKAFIKEIRTLSTAKEYTLGFCYWGAELIAWKGTEATDGSSWENQALFDFDNKALPVIEEFKIK
ncbi:glycoside hydrolase family 53 protein [Flammeovirga agarivorans]|uniref:Arabinogalactan endo-beta-1,4-galactanase n=1 Tax=Flammeovirga agarivorans TaxID=2726742 RepID=A0A7X8SP29_9BACT|nr:glycosyl hydrolase 53 family protein [Flammeovirga agarivorans]NLR93717.1 arabinogalactan endo-1,4-beta-galactosidase [Flammeovirga agarivorans]